MFPLKEPVGCCCPDSCPGPPPSSAPLLTFHTHGQGICVQALNTSLEHDIHGTTLDLLLVSNQRSGACGLTSLGLSFVLSNMELIVSGWQDGDEN